MTAAPTNPPIAIDDPMEAPHYGDSALSRWLSSMLYEARDEVFLRLTARMVLLMGSMMVGLALVLRQGIGPAWAWMAVYFAAWGWFVPPVILMLHNTMHRRFIKSPAWLDFIHPFLMTFFFGIPAGYREHHVGMHHAEDNMWEDLSSTIRYRRDSFAHFLVYFFRFFFLILFELTFYFIRKRRFAMARRAVIGELFYLSATAAALSFDWRFGLIAFVAPMCTCRFMMMAGNWGQHAFINVNHVNNGIANSITCINAGYNKRCFNDGYHIGHHLKANRHWTELPGDFQANVDRYAKEGAFVFSGIDFFMVSLLLWTGQWKVLARRFVRLGEPMTDDEVIALLKSRVQPVRLPAAASLALNG
ncbi:MAG: fatty acid desaturase [Myxococcota bacterium]